MRRIIILTILILLAAFSNAQEVDLEMATQVAQNQYFRLKPEQSHLKSATTPTLVYTARQQSTSLTKSASNEDVLYYVFNYGENEGFVIVAGDQRVKPILGYSYSGSYSLENQPPAFIEWMKIYEKQIKYAISEISEISDEIKKDWSKFSVAGEPIQPVNPFPDKFGLIDGISWEQNEPFNNACPPNSKAGCVAIAMGQVMKFHQYPLNGKGIKSYVDPANNCPIDEEDCSLYPYPEYPLMANFGESNYNWRNIISSFATTNEEEVATAQLVSQLGISVEMDYSPNGSSATNKSAEYALRNYFNYDESLIDYREKDWYDINWKKNIRKEIDNNRPIIYGAVSESNTGPDAGHSFVIDGYADDDVFSFKWGWGLFASYLDGWYAFSLINPLTYNYSESHSAVLGIKVPADIYEPNNTEEDCYLVDQVFMSNSCINAIEANLDILSDADFYKLNLDAGYNYKINSRIYDINSEDDESFHSADASIKIKNNFSWGAAFNEIVDEVEVTNGGEVLVKVESLLPIGQGATGTYKLEINIERTEIPTGPDLVVSYSDVAPISIDAGNSVDVSCAIQNQGKGAADFSTLKYYLSSDADLDANDIYLDSYPVNILAAGEDYEVENKSLHIPANTSTGSNYILFVADANNVIDEGDYENNNVGYKQFFVGSNAGSGPDLVFSSAEINKTIIEPGDEFRIDYGVCNAGTDTASYFRVRFYLSDDISLGSDIDFGTYGLLSGKLPGECTGELQEYITMPEGTELGVKYVLAFIDADNQVAEAEENNNVYAFRITVGSVGVPELIYPLDNAEDISVNPTFFWNDLDGADYYDFAIYDYIDGTLEQLYFKGNLTSTTHAPNYDFAYREGYKWTVRAWKDGNQGDWAVLHDFFTERYLDAPDLYLPGNHTSNVNLAPHFSWENLPEADYYRFKWSTDPTMDDFDDYNGLTNNSFDFPFDVLLSSTQYYWTVTGYHNEHGAGKTSDIFTFRTGGDVPPGIAYLQTPENGAQNVELGAELSWESGSGVTLWHHIEVSDSLNFDSVVFEQDNIESLTYMIPAGVLEPNKEYYWRVRGVNNSGYAEFSEKYSFATTSVSGGPGNILWNAKFGSTIEGIPVFDDEGYLYLKAGFNIVKIDPLSGEIIHTIEGGCYIENNRGLTFSHDGTVLYSIVKTGFLNLPNSDARLLVALNKQGEVLWYADTGYRIAYKPVLDASGNIYVICESGDGEESGTNAVQSFTPAGDFRWKQLHDSDDLDYRSYPVVSGTRLYVSRGASDGTNSKVIALNTSNGSISWSKSLSYLTESEPFAVTSTGIIYTIRDGFQLVYNNKSNSGTIWTYTAQDYLKSTSVVDENGTIYNGTNYENDYGEYGAFAFALSASRQKIWQNAMTNDFRSSSVLDNDGKLYYASSTNVLYCVDKSNGSEIWSMNLNKLVYGMTIGPDGTLYVGTNYVVGDSVTFYAIETNATGLLDSDWPVKGHDYQGTGCYDHNALTYAERALTVSILENEDTTLKNNSHLIRADVLNQSGKPQDGANVEASIYDSNNDLLASLSLVFDEDSMYYSGSCFMAEAGNYHLSVNASLNGYNSSKDSIDFMVAYLTPIFLDQEFSISENCNSGDIIDTVYLESKEETLNYIYSIIEGNDNNVISLDSITGEISVSNHLLFDYELNTSFVFSFVAQDDGFLSLTDTAEIRVNITEFECIYQFSNTDFNFSADGGIDSVNILANDSCTWTSLADCEWVSIISDSTGIGNGKIIFEVSKSFTPSSRICQVLFEDTVINIYQDVGIDTTLMTYVPDDQFEQALINLGYDSGELNDSVPTYKIEDVTALDIRYRDIFDLTGIEDFKALESLIIIGTALRSVDFSENSALVYLNCMANYLSHINVSKNSLLQSLNCANNRFLQVLDVSNNTELDYLYCKGNQLLSLDVTHNTKLERLICYSNQISTLDVTNNTKLTELKCESNLIESLDITNIENLESLYCNSNKLTFESIEPMVSIWDLRYSPQAKIGIEEYIDKNVGDDWDYDLKVGGNYNHYQWYKNDEILPADTSANLVIQNLIPLDAGIYHCNITNSIVPNLTLQTEPITLNINQSDSTICFTGKLEFGWNLFSLPAIPYLNDMKDNFELLIDRESLLKVQDEEGWCLEDRGIFGSWVNEINDFEPIDGFKVKMVNNDSVQICGTIVEYPFAIPVHDGWNILGYPQLLSFNALDIIQQLIDKGSLIKVQDEKGNSIENFGMYGGWQNYIGDMVPGEGYKIKVNAPDTLWIYESYPKSLAPVAPPVPTKHFKTNIPGNGVDHMNFNLVELPTEALNIGDEIAVYDGTTCVGAVVITQDHLRRRVISIPASATDDTGMHGFENGHDYSLRLWEAAQNNEGEIETEHISGPEQFTKHESVVLSLVNSLVTDIQEMIKFSDSDVKCYPNPFSDEINIELDLRKSAEVEIFVLNHLGQKVKFLQKSKLVEKGIHRLIWNGQNDSGGTVSPGIYFLQVGINGSNVFKKMVLMK